MRKPSTASVFWILTGVLGILCAVIRLTAHHPGPTWDEAMNLLSTEAVLLGREHTYSYWFWRHPPLYKGLIALGMAQPYPAWTSNLQVIHAAVSCLNLGLLLWVLIKTHDRNTALLAAFAWVLIPGARFYDPWIKADVLVNTFGLLAVGTAARFKYHRAGLFLGLALLTKETAAIWAIPVLWMLPVKTERKRVIQCLALAGLVCLPWYVFRIEELTHYLAFATGLPIKQTADWSAPWTTYWTHLPVLLGPVGLLLTAIALWNRRAEWSSNWPLAMVVPGLLLLSVIRGKPPWLLMTFQPALAALCGIGAARLLQWSGQKVPKPAQAGVALICVAGLGIQAGFYDSDLILKKLSPQTHWGTHSSQEAADLIETHVPEDASFAVSPMYYWERVEKQICPILLCSLTRQPSALIYPPPRVQEDYLRLVQDQDLDWVLVSPTPDTAERELFPLMRDGSLHMIVGQGAILITTPLFSTSRPGKTSHE